MSAIFWTGLLLFIAMGCGIVFVLWQGFWRGNKNTKR
jgi:hypothetical protein